MADTTISEVTQELQARKDKIAGSGPKADKQAAKERPNWIRMLKQ